MNLESTPSRAISVPAHVDMVGLLGTRDEVLRTLERVLDPVRVHVRGNDITLTSPSREHLELAADLVDELVNVVEAGERLTPDAVERAVSIMRDGIHRPTALLETDILSANGRTIRPKTLGQKEYVDAIDANDIVFGIGPAGTGKTYLAVAKAVVALQRKQVSRIILTRPAVEAGESLGFLPGTLTEKINPYLRPLYDAMYDMLESDALPKLMAAGTIEVAPLAYMRGRTLNDAFVILDEAQNTTGEQMKMFLTRMGFRSKMVITGDATQVDLPGRTPSGLLLVRRILRDIDGIRFVDLTSADVVRHRLVADIIDAYARHDAARERREATRGVRFAGQNTRTRTAGGSR